MQVVHSLKSMTKINLINTNSYSRFLTMFCDNTCSIRAYQPYSSVVSLTKRSTKGVRHKLELGGAQCCLPVTVDTQVSDDLMNDPEVCVSTYSW